MNKTQEFQAFLYNLLASIKAMQDSESFAVMQAASEVYPHSAKVFGEYVGALSTIKRIYAEAQAIFESNRDLVAFLDSEISKTETPQQYIQLVKVKQFLVDN